MITSYFDDCTIITWKTAAQHATLVVETFFQQMGWTVSPEERKNSPFSEVFDTLGVRFDLSRQEEGTITVGNTPTRIAELTQALRDVLHSDVCPLSRLNPFAGVFFSQNATFRAATAVKQSLRWETSLPAYQTKPPYSQPRSSQSSSSSSIRSPKLQSTFRSSHEPRPSYGSTAPANGMRPTLHPRAA